MRNVFFIGSVAVFLTVGALGFAYAQGTATKGRVPEDAVVGGRLNMDRIPDYVPALARDGSQAGFIRKNDLFDEDGVRRVKRMVVVDDTLKAPVGHMVPGRGFVPLGVPEDEVPRFEATVSEVPASRAGRQ